MDTDTGVVYRKGLAEEERMNAVLLSAALALAAALPHTLSAAALHKSDVPPNYRLTLARATASDPVAQQYHTSPAPYAVTGARSVYTTAFHFDGFPNFGDMDDTLSSFGSPAAARQVFALNVRHFSVQGTGDRWTPLGRAHIGQQSRVWELSIHRPDYTYQVGLILVRQGADLMSVRIMALDTPNLKQVLRSYAAIVDHRLRR